MAIRATQLDQNILRKVASNETAMVPANGADLCCPQINVGFSKGMDERQVLEKYIPIFAKRAFFETGLNLVIRQYSFLCE